MRKKRKKRNGVERRTDRARWGYRLCYQGRTYKRYAWATREEARAALIELKRELESQSSEPELPPTALIAVINDYLSVSAENGRSKWRVDNLRWNFKSAILPFFGEAMLITSITTDQIRRMVIQRKRKVKPKTVWHDVTNLRALFNFACTPRETEDGKKIPPLLRENPVDNLDMSLIGSIRVKKAPLDLAAVDKAAAVLDPDDRVYFDFLRFTGLRKDEANRVKWEDVDFEKGYFHCRGTKTDDSDAYLPLAPALIESLERHRQTRTSEYVFPGRGKHKDKRIYDRARMFNRIQKEAGIKLVPKDLRDYFASTVQTDDPRVLMQLMRHTSLTTTTKYVRAMHERMKDAVKNLGATLGASQNGLPGQKSAQNDTILILAELLKRGVSADDLTRIFTLLDHVETAIATDLIHADKHAMAFALGIFVDLGFDHAVHDLRANGAFLVDGRCAVEAPADPAVFIVIKHAEVGIGLEVCGACAEGAVPKSNVLVVKDEGAAANADVGKAVVGRRRPHAILFLIVSLADPLLHFIGHFDHRLLPY